MRLTSRGDSGKPIHELLSDYNQDKADWLRVCRFLPAQNRIEIFTVNSANGKLCSGTTLVPEAAQHCFTLDYPMAAAPK
jgi:hypothetical protein